MKKITTLIFAFAMILSIAFIGQLNASSDSQNPFAAHGQATVMRKSNVGVGRKISRGGKYVVRKSWNGTKYVSKKVWSGTKWTGRKTYKTGRKVVSRTKKVVY